jgi:hypothetical protein
MQEFGKNWRPARSPDASVRFAERLDELRSSLLLLDPALVAVSSGAAYLPLGPGRGELHVPLWGNVWILTWPGLTGFDHLAGPVSDFQLALILYYLITADGMPSTGVWVSFADLPDGRVYNAAFQGYSGDALVKAFDLDLDALHDSYRSAGGVPADLASASYIFQPLPQVPLLITYWLGDEDSPSSCKILFDRSISHYLPIEACAILGSMLVRRLVLS